MIYATASMVRRNPSRNNIGMLLAVVFYVMCYTEGSLVRANVIDFLPLGPYGVLGFILVMSMALNQQHSDERKAAALAIEEEHRRLETILKTANEGIYILDPDGLLVEANDAFHEEPRTGQVGDRPPACQCLESATRGARCSSASRASEMRAGSRSLRSPIAAAMAACSTLKSTPTSFISVG